MGHFRPFTDAWGWKHVFMAEWERREREERKKVVAKKAAQRRRDRRHAAREAERVELMRRLKGGPK